MHLCKKKQLIIRSIVFFSLEVFTIHGCIIQTDVIRVVLWLLGMRIFFALRLGRSLSCFRNNYEQTHKFILTFILPSSVDCGCTGMAPGAPQPSSGSSTSGAIGKNCSVDSSSMISSSSELQNAATASHEVTSTSTSSI